MPIQGTTRRVLSGTVAITAVVLLASGCLSGSWGVRESFRDYVTSGIAQGNITTVDGASWTDGEGSGKGPFSFKVQEASYNAGTGTGYVQLRGGARMVGHASGGEHILDLMVSNPRLEIDGATGTLIADLNYRPLEGFAPATLPKLKAAPNTPFATVDLSTVNWTPSSGGEIVIANAPTTGITAAMQLIGFDQFYGDPVILDNFSTTFNPSAGPTMAAEPKIRVSRTDNLVPGDQITVWGEGFDPNANTGTRPPLAGQKSGVYVTFGKFAATWQPSTGAAGSTRTVIDQKWALPPASAAIIDPTGTGTTDVLLDEWGRFEATLTVAENGSANPNYGVYVYPGSGAVNAAHELSQPTSFAIPPAG